MLKAVTTISRVALIFGVIFAISSSLPVQAQELLWSTNYGGTYNDDGYSCYRTSDGGYAALGSTYSYGAGEFDIYLVRISSEGDTLWTATYGGAATDYGYDIRGTFDGGFVITGSTTSFGAGKRDVIVIRTNEYGTALWTKTFGGAENDEGWSIRQTPDSGFVVCGTTNSFGAGYSDVYLLKLNATGDTTWTHTYGGIGGDLGYAVRRTTDGGYILVGTTGSFGEGYSSMYVVKTNATGDTLWTSTYGGAKADIGQSVELTLDGGYIFVGSSWSYRAGYADAYVVKTDAYGTVQWENGFGGDKEDCGYAICPTSDGGYVLGGTTESFGAGSIDIYVVKLDPLGVVLWSSTYGGSRSDFCRSVVEIPQNQVLLLGRSYSYSKGGTDFYFVKITNGSATPVDEPWDTGLPDDFQLAQNYPNPFNLTTNISYTLPRRSSVTLTIYNVLGQQVRRWHESSVSSGTHIVSWDGTDERGHVVSSGIYLYSIITDSFRDTKKMVLVK